MKGSTPKLSEAARYLVVPAGAVSTGWPAVREILSQLAVPFDWWQSSLGSAILAKGADGKYAADAVALSIPRQVGKTYLVGALIFALCILQPKSLAIWTAHHGATASDTFRDLKALALQPEVQPFVKSVYDSGARQEIIFKNGSIIRFGAREHGFGRGFKRVAILVFDEAQILSARSAEDMVPTTNRHPNPLIFYMGTPPKPSDPCEHFLALRLEAIGGESTDTLYCEFSADPDADDLDRDQWAKANPSYPVHTTARAMLRMRKNLKGPGAFRREALGIWDDLAEVGVFARGAWAACLSDMEPGELQALGLASDLDYSMLSLGAFGSGHLGAVLRLRYQQRAEMLAEIVRIAGEHSIPVGIDGKSPAAPLIADLEAAGVNVVKLGLDDMVQACADVKLAVENREVTHGGYGDLDSAVDAATWRTVGERRLFGRKKADIGMLEAVTIARFAAQSEPNYDVLSSVF